MELSKFQFSEPKLIELEYIVSHDLKEKPRDNSPGVSINIERNHVMAINEPAALVTLIIKTNDTDNSPFRINCVMQSEFRWEPGYDERTLNKFLRFNAPALLISFARPILHYVSDCSVYGDFKLPFINFADELYEEGQSQ